MTYREINRELVLDEKKFASRVTFTVTVYASPAFRAQKWLALRLIMLASWLYGAKFRLIDDAHEQLRQDLEQD